MNLTALSIFAAGGLGALARYSVALMMASAEFIALPWLAFWATFSVNVIGSFLIGFIAILAEQNQWPALIKLTLITGFLGGFTTFSAFSLESVRLLGQQTMLAMTHIILTVIICLVAAALGMSLARQF